MITLDEKFRIEQDTHSIVLIQEIKYDKVDKQKNPTGEQGIKERKTYHPNIALALKSYLTDVDINQVDRGIVAIIEKQKEIEDKIDDLRKIYKV